MKLYKSKFCIKFLFLQPVLLFKLRQHKFELERFILLVSFEPCLFKIALLQNLSSVEARQFERPGTSSPVRFIDAHTYGKLCITSYSCNTRLSEPTDRVKE